ncbi:glycoside hydrolase family 38 C-terminal domain-containing protein [Paenibacillus aurantius]|uniref:Glycoside hydrolase family 38 C-terminal domain-containing protein n=1 Tax=Paenibacillus aurantius TaxID=2918900 RepID=A0AA96RB38_9BACL|nr:glycoside hydrolase family 38 C-terminal domain-containing protein [Paenibacillus aurantius]WNQ09100.1 glycoside hydrolase family 38 C-terminal domain-containing protein [Paenibacillus aurantius]
MPQKNNKPKLHMIGNAHLDPVWLWPWQEGFQETKATFRSALDRMKECDDFLFTSSSAASYEWVENNDPAMFQEIKERIAEGRWQIVGGWWIQPDCNLPSGESFVRQGLYGQRYFKEKFGVTAKVGYNVDSFGHFGMMPQILKKSGMDYYVMMRPMPNEKGLPGRLFQWESDDGSRVLTFRILFEYCTWGKDLEKHVRRCATELKAPFDELMCFYGVGNHGGGPTKENLESIRRMQNDPDLPELVFSQPNQFFEEVEGRELPFPVVHDDLQHHASGCYAAHSGVKQWNRKSENLMIAAEKYSSVAQWTTGQPYPVDFGRAWKNILFNQFHDILAGTSIESAYEDARNEYGEAMAIASRGLNYAVQSLSWNIGIEQEEGMKPFVVFNPHSWQSRVNVEVEVGGLKEEHVLVDEEGRAIPFQRVQPVATSNGRYRVSFLADLPPLGYRVYKMTLNPAATKPSATAIKANDYSMENERFRLEFDPKTGWISSLFDKKVNTEVLRGDGAKPVVIEDKTDTWSHNVFHFNNVIGAFTATSVKLVEHGPVKSVIRVTSEYGRSRLVQDFTMYRELDQIDVKAVVDWREQFKMLKLVFPVNLIFTRQSYEQPFGYIEREHNGEEEPGQTWVDYSGIVREGGTVYGLSLMNDSKYSYSIHNKELALTVLRSPIYAHHDPLVPDPDGHYSFIDQGIQHLNYSLFPHEGGWETAGTVKRAAELNQRPTVIIETYHEGELPQTDSFLSIDQDNIIMSALKQAEDNDDLILRCYETSKIATKAVIRLPKWNRTIEADFGPCEIKTFRIPKNLGLTVTETNLLEW